jgi:hypothetical protein
LRQQQADSRRSDGGLPQEGAAALGVFGQDIGLIGHAASRYPVPFVSKWTRASAA